MKIRIDELKGRVLHREDTEPVEAFPILAEMNGVDCTFLTPVEIAVDVRREPDHIRVEGVAGTRIKTACSRCLDEFETSLESRFTIFFREDDAEIAGEEVELSEKDLISSTYHGNEIDLNPEIAEQVVMEIPVKPLCREECKGLCPNCGADLNRGACTCGDRNYNPKFSALKDFKVNK